MASPPHPLKVASVVSFYMIAALTMVFANKAVLLDAPLLPLTFLLLQLLLAVALLHLTALLGPSLFTLPTLTTKSAKALFPVVGINIAGLVFNTLCLREVDASYFQIARGLNLPMTIFASSMTTRSVPSKLVILAAGLVSCGFLVGIAPGSLTPSISGIVLGVLSSASIALHAVLIKSSLPHCANNTIHLAYWTNLGSAAILLPFVFLAGEPFVLAELLKEYYQARAQGLVGLGLALGGNAGTGAAEVWTPGVFVVGSLITGVFGFLVCIAGLLSIKVTSPVTHMFSGAARTVIQTLLGVWIFHDMLTVNRAASIFVIALGTMYYTWVKHSESSSSKPTSPSTSSASSKDEKIPLHSTTSSQSSSARTSDVDEKDFESSLSDSTRRHSVSSSMRGGSETAVSSDDESPSRGKAPKKVVFAVDSGEEAEEVTWDVERGQAKGGKTVGGMMREYYGGR